MTDASTHSVSIDRARPWLAGLLLGLILFSGFFIRFDSLFHWLEHKERYFFDQQSTPLTLTVDAYYYLDIAKQLNAGTYQSRDPRRKAPQGLKRNPTPPLISVLLAGLAGISSLSLEMIAIMLPALWGALIGIPAYLLAEHLFRRPTDQNQARWLSASQAAGLLAAAVTLLAPKLVLRTSIGWFDTDGLNLLFSLMAAYLALRLLDSRSRRELLLWFTAGAANLLLFLWNWDQSPVGALALGATPFGLALLLTAWRRPRFLQALIIPGMAVLGILIWWKGLDIINPARHLHILGNYLDYFTNQVAETSPFPDKGRYVSEQTGAKLGQIAVDVAGHLWVWWTALGGLLALFWLGRCRGLLLLPLLLVSLLAFEAKRFELFMSPLVGLGLGALLYLLWRLRLPIWLKPPLLLLAFGLSGWNSLLKAESYNKLTPRRTPVLFDAMRVMAEKSEPDSLIWASWGHGHALVHYTDRATLADGVWHPAGISYVINYPLTVNSYRLAANWMQFYAAHGMPGLEDVNRRFGQSKQDWATAMPRFQALLAAGPDAAREQLRDLPDGERESLLRFIFPQKVRPILLFAEHLHAYTDWYGAGAWDFARRRSPSAAMYLPLEGIKQSGRQLLQGRSKAGVVRINRQKGLQQIGRKALPLKRLEIFAGKDAKQHDYRHKSPVITRLNLSSGTGVTTQGRLADSVYSSLFYVLESNPKYFQPFELKPPHYGLWRVSGDSYSPP